jgi:hypothetical protein
MVRIIGADEVVVIALFHRSEENCQKWYGRWGKGRQLERDKCHVGGSSQSLLIKAISIQNNRILGYNVKVGIFKAFSGFWHCHQF